MKKSLILVWAFCLIVSVSTQTASGMKQLGYLASFLSETFFGSSESQAPQEPAAAASAIAQRIDFGMRQRYTFFRDIMGFDERSFDANIIKDKIIFEPTGGLNGVPNFKIKGGSDRNGEVAYQCGFLEQISLGQLRDQATQKAQSLSVEERMPIRFNVIEADGFGTAEFVDIGALQADPENRDAVFQVASNFNALETLSHTDMDNVYTVSSYWRDNTQGPRASISAAAGLIYRRYYYFFPENNANPNVATWAQQAQAVPECRNANQINFLEDLGVKTMNGYVWENKIHDSGIENIRPENASRFKIGFHHNTQVVFGATRGREQQFFYDPNQLINQVFAAALNIGQALDLCAGVDIEKVNLILSWTYEATLKAAFVKGKKKVFLTRIGGGAFGNSQAAIDEAVINAVNDPDLANSGLEVTLNNFILPDENVKMAVRKRLIASVKKHDGLYMIY